MTLLRDNLPQVILYIFVYKNQLDGGLKDCFSCLLKASSPRDDLFWTHMAGAHIGHRPYGEHIAQQVAVHSYALHAREGYGCKSREAPCSGSRPDIENGHIETLFAKRVSILREYPTNGWL
jgi:hypothetical protein